MKIHEYQGKAVLAQYGVPVPKGKVAYTADEAVEAVDFLLHGFHQLLEPLGAGALGRPVFRLDVIDGEADEVQRVADLVGDPP